MVVETENCEIAAKDSKIPFVPWDFGIFEVRGRGTPEGLLKARTLEI